MYRRAIAYRVEETSTRRMRVRPVWLSIICANGTGTKWPPWIEIIAALPPASR